MSQQNLAERAKISVVYMSNLEKGDKKRGTLETYSRLAKALDVSLTELVSDVKVAEMAKDDLVSVRGLDATEKKVVEKMVRALRAGHGKKLTKKS